MLRERSEDAEKPPARERLTAAPKAWFWAVLYGTGGNMLLFFFLCTFLPFSEAAKFVPLAVAFTGAASGYTFLDRIGAGRPGRYGSSAACGGAVGALTWGLINAGGRFISGLGRVTVVDLLLFVCIGILFSLLGAWLAVKWQRLRATNE
jgi:hypothetical protein